MNDWFDLILQQNYLCQLFCIRVLLVKESLPRIRIVWQFMVQVEYLGSNKHNIINKNMIFCEVEFENPNCRWFL